MSETTYGNYLNVCRPEKCPNCGLTEWDKNRGECKVDEDICGLSKSPVEGGTNADD